MSGNSTIAQICGALLLLAVLGSVVALAFRHIIQGSDAIVLITAIVGIAGGAASHASGVNAGANAASNGKT